MRPRRQLDRPGVGEQLAPEQFDGDRAGRHRSAQRIERAQRPQALRVSACVSSRAVSSASAAVVCEVGRNRRAGGRQPERAGLGLQAELRRRREQESALRRG